MSYTAQERETVINFNDEENCAYIFTAQRYIITKLDKLCISNPEAYTLLKETPDSKTYKCTNRKLISFRTPTTRTMSDEQKKAASERLAKARENKNNV